MSFSAGLLPPGQGTWPDTMSHTGWADQMLTAHLGPAAGCNGGVTVNPSGGLGTCSHNSWEAHAKQCSKMQVVCADTAVWLLRWCMCRVGQPARMLCGAASAPPVGFDRLPATRTEFANVAIETLLPANLPSGKLKASAGISRDGRGGGLSHPVYVCRRMCMQVEPQ